MRGEVGLRNVAVPQKAGRVCWAGRLETSGEQCCRQASEAQGAPERTMAPLCPLSQAAGALCQLCQLAWGLPECPGEANTGGGLGLELGLS